MPDLVCVTPLAEHRLLLEYRGGERRCFDLRPLLGLSPWTPLADERLFRRAAVVHGTVSWPGEIDIAPETLYEDSLPWAEGSSAQPG